MRRTDRQRRPVRGRRRALEYPGPISIRAPDPTRLTDAPGGSPAGLQWEEANGPSARETTRPHRRPAHRRRRGRPLWRPSRRRARSAPGGSRYECAPADRRAERWRERDLRLAARAWLAAWRARRAFG